MIRYTILIAFATILSCTNTKPLIQQPVIPSSNSNGDFEGKIIYDVRFEDKTGRMNKEEAKTFMGTEQVYVIKGNKYKSEMNGMMKMAQYYLGSDTLFSYIGAINSLMWTDATSNPNQLIAYEIKTGADTIVGIPCDVLTITSNEGVTQYYFNKQYKVSANQYAKHEYGFWKFCVEKTNALPLKSISDTKDSYFEIVAKTITAIPIDEAEFTLPNLPRIAAPKE